MLDALGCSNGAAKDHGFGHHVPRRTGFSDLDGWSTIPTANATFRQIHQQRSPLHAPLPSGGEQGMKIGEIGLFRRREINQFVSIVVGEPIARCDPASAESTGSDVTGGTEIHPGAPCWIALACLQAEHFA